MIEAILDQCLEDISLKHATLDECLAKYPDYAAELKPLLEAALALEQATDVRPTAEFKDKLRERILNFSDPKDAPIFSDEPPQSQGDK